MVAVLLLLLLSALGAAPLAQGGVCPSYPIIRDFDFRLYTGVWYQQDKQQGSWGTPGRCWRTLYVRDAITGQYKMKLLYQNTITGNRGTYESSITLSGASKPSVIKYSIPYTFMEDSFQVLATDYSTYSVEYQCNPNGILPKTENVFLLTRDKTPPAAVLQKAYSIMHRYGLDLRKLERVDQTCGGVDLRGILKPTELIFGHSVGVDAEVDLYDEDAVEYDTYYDNHVAPLGGAEEEVRRWGGDGSYVSASNVAEYHSDQHGHRVSQTRERRVPEAGKRVALGQSLATRLWRVLHMPLTR